MQFVVDIKANATISTLIACALAMGLLALVGVANALSDKMMPAAQITSEEDFAGGLIGSKHDFTESGKSTRDLCLPCHTPHITSRAAPLLTTASSKRDQSERNLSRAVMYDDSSRLCLSCHDGVVATDVYATPHATTWREQDGGAIRGGRARITSHPVGVRYPVGRRDYYPQDALGIDSGKIKLPEGRIQCISCHDPHNSGRHAGMLSTSNERSRLCLACHRL